jgi:hypothetical protein
MMVEGAPRPFIGVEGAPGRGGRELIAALMALTRLKALRPVNAQFEGD